MNVEPTPPDPQSGKTEQWPVDEVPLGVGLGGQDLFSAQTATHRSDTAEQPAAAGSARSHDPADPQLSSIPTALGRFHHIEVVKSGGFGIVCRAQDSQAGRTVALKFPRQEKLRDQSDLKLFVDEANRAMELEHPGIVRTYAVEESEGLLAIVQEFIEGSDLRSEQSSLTNHQVIAALIAKIADALGYAHRRGVYHRDLKPANILLDRQGNPYITDFGLAMHEREQLFLPRQRCGTPHYMPPEQVAGLTRRLDGRSDIWSLGVILYELLTQRKPFQGTSEHEIFDQIEHNDPRPPRQIDPTIDRELQRICLKCLERQQRDRYPTADDLAEDLRHWIANPAPERSKTGQRFVPRGLRPFTTDDADFFLELLPGSRDRNGLPTSIKFWLNRIVSPTTMDLLTPVGVILGPSGSGKSSFFRAGLLPLLTPEILTITVDCTPTDTESRMRKLIWERLEGAPEGIGLVDLCAGLAQGLWRPKGKSKILLVLDQFEQRLSRGDDFLNADLAKALRFCEGRALQTLLLCRDDFYLHLSRFADGLGMDLREGDNAQAIDLFDRKHARKVLIKYGQAFGQLPDQAVELTAAQEEFLSAVVSELSVADFIVCMQLVLFAEMFRARPWTLSELSAVGGVSGIGEKFLEANFGPTGRDKRLRSQAATAQKILAALLPPPGSDIRSGSKSEIELRTAVGLDSDPTAFAAVMKSLDGQLKLITRVEATAETDSPTAPVASALPPLVLQLTHDTMIHSIRTWLERQSSRTRAGRAGLRLRELGLQVLPGQQPRYLPTRFEWVTWRWWLRNKPRTTAEQAVWKAAGQRFFRDLGIAVTVLIASGLGSAWWIGQEAHRERERQVDGQINALLNGQIEVVPDALAQLDRLPDLARPRLQRLYQSQPIGSSARTRSALGLLPSDPNLRDELLAAALSPETLPDPMAVIVHRLGRSNDDRTQAWSAIYHDADQDLRRRFRAFVAEVTTSPVSSDWATQAPAMAAALAAEPSPTWRRWLELLQPAKTVLLPAFQELFAREYPAPEPLALGIVALQPTTATAVEQWVNELTRWKAPQFQAAMDALLVHGCTNEYLQAARQRLAQETDPWARAILSVSLARCEDLDPLVEVYSQETESPATIYAVHASVPGRLNPNVLRKIYQQQGLDKLANTHLRRSVLLAYGLQAPSIVDNHLKDWLAEMAFYHVVHDPDACCFSAAELILRHLGQDPSQRGRPERRANSNADGILGQVLIDQTGLAFSLLPAPDAEDGSRQIAVCTTELTLPEILKFLEQTPAAVVEFGRPNMPLGLGGDTNETTRAPFLHRRAGNDLALVYDYCNWLSRQNQIPESEWSYPLWVNLEEIRKIVVNRSVSGFRLLTTAEWQLANRSGESLLKRASPDGPVVLDYAWSIENSPAYHQAVGHRLPNAAGVFDMFGNVEEVVHVHASDDAFFLELGQTIRADASAFNNTPQAATARLRRVVDLYTMNVGFRIMRTVATRKP